MGDAVTLGVSGWRLHGQRTGVGRYILNLIQHWTSEVVAGQFDRMTVYSPSDFVGETINFPTGIAHRVLGPLMPMIAWENLRLGPAARESVMLYPSFSRPLLTHGASVVVTHDATMRLHPELFTKRDKLIYDPLYGWSSRASTLVITTTNAAKADIVREWNVDPEKIRVTHLASAECFRPLPDSVDRNTMRARLTGAQDPYFFFVGKLSGRRNIPRLLEAFAQFRATSTYPHRLVVVGPQYAIAALEKMADELNVRASLITRTFVGDEELNDLYNCADAFIMPSTYETVSFPIMEAQAAGTPVICIDTPGSREITGGEALLIARLDVKELVEAMIRLASDGGLRADLAARGLRNSRNFSWQRCARMTLDVCAEAARMKGRPAA
ncbi:MAG: glycosyltransferase family 4 protein [Gemmatimonadaceae bacterium]|nr:glycosyltransferase family 4 protein [Gemmatimonadaceae bacterium]